MAVYFIYILSGINFFLDYLHIEIKNTNQKQFFLFNFFHNETPYDYIASHDHIEIIPRYWEDIHIIHNFMPPCSRLK